MDCLNESIGVIEWIDLINRGDLLNGLIGSIDWIDWIE
jgi:hypothetical protein